MTERALPATLPIVLLNGYLGAGKTTLLNQLLAEANGRHIAILVNDFGSINIDAGLVKGAIDGVVALQDGCICCSMAAGMQKAIYQVLKQQPRPEVIVIEASGVSNPAEIGRILNDPEMRPYARLEFVVTLLDCEQFSSYSDVEKELVQSQVMAADLVLLTKTDLVNEGVIAHVHNASLKLNPGVLILDNQTQSPSLDFILGQSARSDGAQVTERLQDMKSLGDAKSLYQSWVFQSQKSLSQEELEQVLKDLPKSTVRGKGEVYLQQYPGDRFILQMVGKRVKIEPVGTWGIGMPRTQIIFIALKDSFKIID